MLENIRPFTQLTPDECWEAVASSDRTYDGVFVTGVTSTGIYCRPSCPARLPKRENVIFHEDCAAAERAGFRACKRCQPDQRDAEVALVEQVCRHIDAHPAQTFTLAALGEVTSVSSSHLHRVFKRVMGITPRQYADSRRLETFTDQLKAGTPITSAALDAGYGSSSRVYEHVPTQIGMTPAEYQNGADGIDITYTIIDSPLGRVLIGATTRGICAVTIDDNDDTLINALHSEYPSATIQRADGDFEDYAAAILAYLHGEEPHLDLPIDIRVTAFQRRVLDTLRTIPYGETWSYAEVAHAIGKPTAARAVGRACATNPVALVIPCHRVTRADGGLSGYRWGVDRKVALLALEKANT